MRKKKAAKPKSSTIETKVPDWVLDHPPVPKKPLTKQGLNELAAGVESGIRDTQAWKALVRRVGRKEVVRLLKARLFARHGVHSDPNN
jgi:hypothetical protein